MLVGLVLLAGGVLLVRGAVVGEHPWSPVVEAFGGDPLPAPGSTSMGEAVAGAGAVFGDQLAPAPASSGANAVGDIVAAAARADIGLGYDFGHIGPPAEDCSALSMRAYAAAGISLIHNAAAQLLQCRVIRKKNADVGDLIFMPLGETKISHVAMYLGAGQTIEAAPSHGVGIVPVGYQPGPHIYARPTAAFQRPGRRG